MLKRLVCLLASIVFCVSGQALAQVFPVAGERDGVSPLIDVLANEQHRYPTHGPQPIPVRGMGWGHESLPFKPQEPFWEDRAESLCFGWCGNDSLFQCLQLGTCHRRSLPALPDVELPAPPYGPKAWSPWTVCLSLGISPVGTLVCREWGYAVQDPRIHSPYWISPIRTGRTEYLGCCTSALCMHPDWPGIVDDHVPKRLKGLPGRIALY